MFKDVGKELKGRAQEYVLGRTALYGFLGGGISLAAIALVDPEYLFLSFVIGAICAVVGYFVAREKAIMLYAYGELVDCVKEMKELMCEKKEVTCEKKQEEIPVSEQATPSVAVERDPYGGWKCPFCDGQNLAKNKFCQHCGIEVEFESSKT